ncbi:MAG: hypothetical protein ACK2U9_14555, partial [Anaerolineae bacterium]
MDRHDDRKRPLPLVRQIDVQSLSGRQGCIRNVQELFLDVAGIGHPCRRVRAQERALPALGVFDVWCHEPYHLGITRQRCLELGIVDENNGARWAV